MEAVGDRGRVFDQVKAPKLEVKEELKAVEICEGLMSTPGFTWAPLVVSYFLSPHGTGQIPEFFHLALVHH